MYILYILGKCVQSYTSVKTVLLWAIPTVIRTYYYDQYYGSALFLLKITYLLPYIRVKLQADLTLSLMPVTYHS